MSHVFALSGIRYSPAYSSALVTYENHLYRMDLYQCSTEEKATEIFKQCSHNVELMFKESQERILILKEDLKLFIVFVGYGKVSPCETLDALARSGIQVIVSEKLKLPPW